MPKRVRHFASYHESIFDKKHRERIARQSCQLIKALRERDNSLYAIVGTGLSGMLGMLVANRLDMEYIHIRKENEVSHDFRRVCGHVGSGRFVFYDDLIDSGATLCRVLDVLDKENGRTHEQAVMPDLGAVVCYDADYHKTRLFRDFMYTGNPVRQDGIRKYAHITAYSVKFYTKTGKL